MRVEIGQELGGRFRLERRLGRGAMGEVWLAWDPALGRKVAIKLLPPEFLSDPERVKRFRREAQMSASLQHPGIATVHDVGTDHGQMFFVMEYLDGENLSAVIRRHSDGFDIERALGIAVQVAEALAAAHGGGVVHRDIKSSNIMVSRNDRVKICDFGIARLMDSTGSEPGTVGVGTPAYMAPEQFERSGDERSDLYSYGCVLYEMLTGRRPFDGTPAQLAFKHREISPERPGALRPDVSDELDELVLELLEKRSVDRPESAVDVTKRVRGIRRSLKAPVLPPVAETRRVDPDVPVSKPSTPPSLDLLGSGSPVRSRTAVNEQVSAVIREVLERSGVKARFAGFVRGPVTSVYEIRPAPDVEAAVILGLAGAVSEALGGIEVVPLSSVRSSSPLPGVMAVGFEIPNADRDLVCLGDVLRAHQGEAAPLSVALGRGASGPVMVDLGSAPQLLIAGCPGAGRSVALHTVVMSLLVRDAPTDVRLAVIDNGHSGMEVYAGIPHLFGAVARDVPQAKETLAAVVAELHRRYDDLSAVGRRTVDAYNLAVRKAEVPTPVRRLGAAHHPHPYLVIVVAELADLMRTARRDVEPALSELARLGRAVGIHLVVATAHPVERVLTGRIRADVPARLAMTVSSPAESDLVVDIAGAERLTGKGDALYLAPGATTPVRLQTCYVSKQEIDSVVGHWTGSR